MSKVEVKIEICNFPHTKNEIKVKKNSRNAGVTGIYKNKF